MSMKSAFRVFLRVLDDASISHDGAGVGGTRFPLGFLLGMERCPGPVRVRSGQRAL